MVASSASYKRSYFCMSDIHSELRVRRPILPRDKRARLAPGVFMLAFFWSTSGSCAQQAQEVGLGWNEMDATACSLRTVTSADLLGLREIGGEIGQGLSVSPNGRHFALEVHQADVESDTYRAAWFVSGTAMGSSPRDVGDAGDATLFRNRLADGRIVGAWVSDYAKWSPDSQAIVYRKKLQGETQLWMSFTEGGGAKQLTHNAADIEDFYWSEDGSSLYFTTDADRAYFLKARESRYRNGHVYDYDKDWSTIDGQPLYPPYFLSAGQPRVWKFDLVTGSERLATAENLVEFERLARPNPSELNLPKARSPVLSKDRNGVAWLQPDDPERQGQHPPMTLYASLALDGSNPVRCAAKECTGIFDTNMPLKEGLHWSTIDDEILFVRKDGFGYSKRSLYGWRIGDRTVRKVLSTDEWLSDCSITSGRAICFRETPVYPRTVIAIDLDDGSVDVLLDPNPEFRCISIGKVELMEWENSSGYKSFGYLVLPPDYDRDTRYPLVFVGYRARYALRGGVGNEYPVHLLAKSGLVVLVYDKPDIYAAREIYSDPIDIGKARWGPDLFDVSMPLASFDSAIRILAKRELIDPDRVAVTGLSNGIGHVNYALIHSDLFAAAITSSSDFGPNGRVLIGASGDLAREYRRATGAGSYPGPDGFLFPHMSVSLNTDRVRAPLLVNVSDHEHPWALEEVVALEEAGKAVEMVVYPDEGHIKWHPAHRASVYERNVDWLRFWLQDFEDEDPAKSRRYDRWRALREKLAAH